MRGIEMNQFKKFVIKISKGAINSFQTFPASMICALAFTVATMVQIESPSCVTVDHSFLQSSLHWALGFGALLSLTLVTFARSRFDKKSFFVLANIVGIAAASIAFFALYYAGGIAASTGSDAKVLSDLATSRMIVAMVVSVLVFIVLASHTKEKYDFPGAFFMTHKSFFISLLYGGVIMAGATLIARALQALIFPELGETLYAHFGIVSAFIAFSIFLGYFPDFRKGSDDPHRETAQKQPRFIEILFDYILIPVFAALTMVLLGWAVKTIIGGMSISFTQLFGIAATYTLGGLWLYVMVSDHDRAVSRSYRRFYPMAALVILAFEAWALIQSISDTGLKISEYFFILLWLIATVSSILLIIKKSKAFFPVIYLICALAVVSVLPFIGYQPATISYQSDRLEKLLSDEEILKDEELVPATSKPELSVREDITDAVLYLAGFPEDRLPSWFDKDLEKNDVFKEKLGFAQALDMDDAGGSGDGPTGFISLSPSAIDISDYQWSAVFGREDGKDDNTVAIKGENGTYDISWIINADNGIPTLKITLDGDILMKENLASYLEETVKKNLGSKDGRGALEDMSLEIKTNKTDVLLVFQYIEGYPGPDNNSIYYNLDLNAVYLNEK